MEGKRDKRIMAIIFKEMNKKILNESEDMISDKNGLLCASLRDMIYRHFEDVGPHDTEMDIKMQEVFIHDMVSARRYPVDLTDADYMAVKKICESDPDGYRIMCYYPAGKVVETKWQNAYECIENDCSFEEYTNPESEWCQSEGIDREFADTFKSEDEWDRYVNEYTVKAFKEQLKTAEDDSYRYLVDWDMVHIDDNGIPYALIVWRA